MPAKNKQTKRILFFILAAAFILAGSYLRLVSLNSQPYWLDEGYTVLASLAIMEKGASVLDSGQPYFCPLYCYPAAFLGKISSPSAKAFRLPAAVFGVLLLVLIYAFAQKLFNYRVALLSLFFSTFSYYQIAWSRQARWYTLFALLFLAAWYYFFKFCSIKKKKKISFVLVALFTFLAILAHKIAYLLPGLMVSWLIIDLVFFRQGGKGKILALAGLLGLLAVFDYFYGWRFLPLLAKQFAWHYSLPFYLNFYLRHYWLFIFFALVALFEARAEAKRRVWFLAWPIIVYFFAFSFFTNLIHYRYLFHLTPLIFILAAAGIDQAGRKTKSRLLKAIILTGAVLVFFLTGQGVWRPQNFYFLESDNPARLKRPYYAYTPQPNFNRAYGFVKKHLKSGEIVISTQPAFNKIFLGRAGYWLKYNYTGVDKRANLVQNGREYYVGAQVINNLAELKKLRRQKHGYLIFDYMAADHRLPTATINYIRSSMQLAFFDKINAYSQIWVYRF